MALERSPAFQFYPSDFLADSHVIAMRLPERGAYITLLCLCWIDGSLPVEMPALARLCLVSPASFERLWPALEPCFKVVDGRLVQPRIERERQKQETWRALKIDAGQKGGLAKASNARKSGKQKASRGLAKASPPSSSSSSSSTSVVLSSKEHERERFDAFWRVYPKKVGKDAAWKAWQLRHLSDDLAAVVIAALAWQVQQDNWLIDGGRFVPNPATWINQGRWQDEPSTTPKVNDRTLAAMTATREFLDS